MTPDEIAVAWLGCVRCQAEPGQPCLTRTGRRARDPHEGRAYPVRRGYWLGFEKGYKVGLESAERRERRRAAKAATS